ncbi:zinc finger BED domain-containing protein DAYSLEEPER [Hevea brasiliensis]|uniref:zinc finger BED domain-containing protein DAYSLEEPER n=1 Tax=Hevea brasiliensis TaxID=3981 RepID=UPI0025F529E8|nr:zinc finger BED domain-containing protein DAYSLEEPER [Hevea brasiliensis]XP_021639697.2 zinc finger BED domain-containing protein DAYSLEEPER [Hevea brasiliensis]
MTSMDIDSPSTPIMAITPVILPDNNEASISEEQPNKRRRKKSIVWEHFTIETVGAGCMRACCKQCKKSFAYITGSKLAGTSHLKRHIALGICPVSRQKNEASQLTPGVKTDPPKRRYRATPGLGNIPFDQDRCNHEIAKMIIQHEYPLHIVEHPAFIDFVRTLQPQFNMVSFNTIQGECVAIYLGEKQNLLNLIRGIPGRVNLTLDLNTSNLNIGYAFLTGHFIDDDWNLHRRVLNVVMLPFPDSDYAFNQAVVSCISDWNLENRLFTLTLDQSFANETMVGNLRGLLSVRNPLMFNGQLLKGNCYARVLSRLAQDALGAMGEVTRRIRESVKYVKTSETHDEKFAELRQRLQVPSTKELIIDDQTKWNTTYQMLVAACELKEVFACLDTSDPVYKINPSMDDWKQVEILCTYLKLFYDAACILTAPTYPPANAFYHEVSKVQLELTHAAMSQDPFVSNLTKPLKEKFDQYWRDCFLVLAIAVVMDPRFKMKLVEFSFSRIFGEDAGMWIKIVDDGIHELFLEYLAPNLSLSTTFMEAEDMGISRSEILQEAPNQEVAPQEACFEEVPLQVVYSADVPSLEHSQGAAFKDVKPEEITPQVHPKKESPQDASPQVIHHHEVAQQEMHSQELPMQEMQTQELPVQEMDAQEMPEQDMHTQEAPVPEMQTQEAPMQEMKTKETTVQEMETQEAPVQQMHTQEAPVLQEVPLQDADTREVPAQEMHTQEVSAQEIHAQEIHAQEVSAQEMNAQEVSAQEMNAQEVSAQEMQTQEVSAQEMHTQEVSAQEIHAQEVSAQEIHAQEVSAQEMNAQEVSAQEMNAQEVSAQEVHAQEVSAQEVYVQEVSAQEVRVQEASAQEVHAQEVSAQEMHVQEVSAQEVHAQEVHTQEVPSQEMQVEVISQVMHSREVPTQEMHPPEVVAQEVHSQEVLTQEMHLSEAQTEHMYPPESQIQEVLPAESQNQEMHPTESETKEMHPIESQTQDINPTESQTQEVCPPDAQTQAMHLQEAQTHEMHPQEAETHEMHPQEAQTHDVHSQEVHAHVMHLQETETHRIHPQEAETHETLHQEVMSQEMHPQQVETQEMHHQEFSQEMHHHELSREILPYEGHHQDLPLLSIGDGLSDFDVYISEIVNSQHMKSELDQYLEESLLPRVHEFDVLGWWKLNKLKYPTLSKMAADILSVPISTVAPDSVFDTGSKKIDSYRSSLRPVTLEALVCAKDWLQYGSSALSMETSNAVVKMEY